MSQDHPPLTLQPVSDDQWPAEVAHLAGGWAQRLTIYRYMAHDPALLKSWENLRNHVVLESVLTGIQRELVILRIAYNWKAGYEWAHHVSRGREAGLSDAQIAAAERPLDHLPADSSDRVFFAAVDELMGQGALAPTTSGALNAMVGKAGVIDIMATVGMYTVLAFIAKSFGTQIEPDLKSLVPSW
jgi:4-carboxymuconolactone decarboxylase